MEENKFFDREERIRRFGIDCGDELLWKTGTWQPGGEFCKTLVVKNVGTETVKIMYKAPETQFFSMDFPESKSLSPGITMPIRVIFRPLKLEPYDDHIEFIIRNKKLRWSFHIPVRAVLSYVAVSVPEFEDFGFVPIMEETSRTFEVKNIGNAPAEFRWQVNQPFRIEPAEGKIETSQRFTATFSPVDASVFVSKALFFVKDLPESPVVFKMSGIGKFPFIGLSENRIDFGDCTPGRATEREIVIRNQSFVRASFRISRIESDIPAVFSIEPTAATVEPGESFSLRVKFLPTTSGQFSCDHFKVITPGGNTVQLECCGTCMGPSVSAARPVDEGRNEIQFGECAIGPESDPKKSTSTRVVYICNNSDVPVRFQFLVDPRGEFEFEESQGVIPPRLEKPITVKFQPDSVGNYYRRVYCAIEDQMPLFYDFVGTAYDPSSPEKRPQPLLCRHIETHRKRQVAGWDRETPESIVQIESEGKGKRKLELTKLPEKSMDICRSGNSTFGQLEICEEIFEDNSDPAKVIAVDMDILDFGGVSRTRAAANKLAFRVTNRHRAKVICGWTVSYTGPDEAPFAIFPESQDISPGQTVEFRVMFKPSMNNLYYHATASSFVALKANRTFRLVQDEAFIPPFFLSLQLMGHTFTGGAQQFLPKAQFVIRSDTVVGSSKHVVEFPACHFGEISYCTGVLENSGDTPVKFSFAKDPSNRFDIFPRDGFVEAGRFQILIFRCKPNALGQHTSILRCNLNNSAENHEMRLSCFCSLPKIKLCESDAEDIDSTEITSKQEMYFKPTCLGLGSKRSFVVKNDSRVPLLFDWRIPKRFRSIVSVSPQRGYLRGNEAAVVEWTFTPKSMRKYEVDCLLVGTSFCTDRKSQHGVTELREVLTVTGEGTSAYLAFSEEKLDMGSILANGLSEKTLRLSNMSSGDVTFDFEVETLNTESELTLSTYHGSIGARSDLKINVGFTASKCGEYAFNIRCKYGTISGPETDEDQSMETECSIVGKATYPMMTIEDARCSGLSTLRLWKTLNLAKLNGILQSPVSDAEREYLRLTGVQSAERERELKEGLEQVRCRFPPTVVGGAPVSIALQLKNTGNLSVEFRFRFPNESDIDVESWAESKELTPAQVYESFLVEEKLFEIEPRKAFLAPGEATTLRVVYRPVSLEYEGIHNLHVLLCLLNGKQIRISLEGRTLDSQKQVPCIFPCSTEFNLKPVRIGLQHPPTQFLEFYNPCDFPVQCQVLTHPLNDLKDDNYGFPVLSCENPQSIILPESYHSVGFVFNPIEAKEYECTLQIVASRSQELNGEEGVTESSQVKISGTGFQDISEVSKERFAGDTPPIRQLLPLPAQLASFSTDLVSFGTLVDGSVVKRVLFLRNLTASQLSFRWDCGNPLISKGILGIEPSDGLIEPGSFVLCKMTIQSAGERYLIIKENISCMFETFSAFGDENCGVTVIGSPGKRSVSRASTFRMSLRSPTSRLGRASVQTSVESTTVQKQILCTTIEADFSHVEDLADSFSTDHLYAPADLPAPLPEVQSPSLPDEQDADGLLQNEVEQKTASKEHSESRSTQKQESFLRQVLEDKFAKRVLGSRLLSNHSVPLFADFLANRCEEDERQEKSSSEKKLLSIPAHQDLIESVVENTVFNLIQEAAHGEIDLLTHRTLFFPKNG